MEGAIKGLLLGVGLKEDLRNGGEVIPGKGKREEGEDREEEEEEESGRVLGVRENDISFFPSFSFSFYCFSCF